MSELVKELNDLLELARLNAFSGSYDPDTCDAIREGYKDSVKKFKGMLYELQEELDQVYDDLGRL